MARHPRCEAPGALHHVVAQAASDSRIVRDDSDRLRLLDELRAVVAECNWRCIAFSLMATHLHLVLCTSEPNLAKGMRLLLGRYAFAYNRRHSRRGHVFSDRYWSRRIDRPYYLRCSSVYAVLNPVSAGVCGHPSELRWSSYRETAGIAPHGGFVDASILLDSFAVDPADAQPFYCALVEDALDRLRARRAEESWRRSVEQAVVATLAPG
jgi:REP-associated tyrosine transposase